MASGTEWTTDALIASIQRRASFPTGDEAWSSADILALATEAMRDYVLPVIREVHEEFLVATYDISVTSGVTSYRLPKRVAAEALRLVLMSDGNGGFLPMTRVEPEAARKLQIGFYLEDDKLVLSWSPTQATTVRLKYYWRPSKLVLPAAALTIDGVSSETVCTVSEVPNATAITDLSTVDVVGDVPGFRVRAVDAFVVDALGAYPSITLSGVTLQTNGVEIGNYICLAGESCVPQIPAELHPLLAQRVAVKMGEGQGGSAGYEAALAELAQMERRARSLFAERTEGNPRYVHNFYAPGWGRNTIRRQTGSN